MSTAKKKTAPKKKAAKRQPGEEKMLLCVAVPSGMVQPAFVFRGSREYPRLWVAYNREHKVWCWTGKPVTKAEHDTVMADERQRDALVACVFGIQQRAAKAYTYSLHVRVEKDHLAEAKERAEAALSVEA